jgi:hypothetical protein
MKQRFFLNGINIQRYKFTIDKTVESSVFIRPYSAYSPSPFMNSTTVSTEITPDFFIGKLLIEHRFFHELIISQEQVDRLYLTLSNFCMSSVIREWKRTYRCAGEKQIKIVSILSTKTSKLTTMQLFTKSIFMFLFCIFLLTS